MKRVSHKFIFGAVWIVLALSNGCVQQTEATSQNEPVPNWTVEERSLLLGDMLRSMKDVVDAASGLSDEQWTFHESPDRWTVGEIVEHLQMQDLMYWRELYVLLQFPEMTAYHHLKRADDSVFRSYATVTDDNRSEASWYIIPTGRWSSASEGVAAYQQTREELAILVGETAKDFRQFLTPRKWGDLAEVRDLHQLMLIMVAHTDRHLKQLEQVKTHPEYPK